jgi:excinuclease UvrABC helicase subunit UvrB
MNAIGVCVLSTVLSCAASEAPAPVDVPAISEVLKQFEQESAEIEKDAESEIKKRSDKIVGELKKVQDAYCKEAMLDEAVAVRDLIRALRDGSNAPPPMADLPAAAREVFKQHDEHVTAIRKKADAEIKKRLDKVLGELKKVQDAYCKDAKLDEAVAVRDLIRALKDGTNGALPDPGYLNNPATDSGKVF